MTPTRRCRSIYLPYYDKFIEDMGPWFDAPMTSYRPGLIFLGNFVQIQ